MDTSHNSLLDEADLTFLTRDEELLVERLVDGELQDQEREALIHLLDERVDGWRFLALTFLEEQTLRQALKNIKPEDYSDPMPRARSFQKEQHSTCLLRSHMRLLGWQLESYSFAELCSGISGKLTGKHRLAKGAEL